MPYQTLADALLVLHFVVVAFVVLGLPAILVGNWRGWPWVNQLWWRLAHLAAIAVVVVQAWLGQHCALTVWESQLRLLAGQAVHQQSFIQHWVQRLLYHEAPLWLFAVVYTGFAAAVVWAWWRHPPQAWRRR
jgi:hypothetical protein